MKFYKIDHAKTFQQGGQLQYKSVNMSDINPAISKQLFFALNKEPDKFKPGKRVRITEMQTSAKQMGTVWSTNNGIPSEIQLDSGKIIPIFGLIIELLPILEKLIELIKGLFKK